MSGHCAEGNLSLRAPLGKKAFTAQCIRLCHASVAHSLVESIDDIHRPGTAEIENVATKSLCDAVTVLQAVENVALNYFGEVKRLVNDEVEAQIENDIIAKALLPFAFALELVCAPATVTPLNRRH